MQALNPKMLRYLEDIAFHEPLKDELKDLQQLSQAGFIISPTLVIPAAVEEAYYRLNNLPEQLSQLFKNINLSNADEDDIEELEPLALALFKKHFLLDEFIDLFYSALVPLPSKLCIRRPRSEGSLALKGRPTLIALKDLWAQAWTFDVLIERLERSRSIAIEARDVLIQAKNDGQTYDSDKASELLNEEVKLQKDLEGRITRVLSAKSS